MNYYKYEYFLGKGTNLLYIRGICGMYSDEIQIQDLYYYALENKILSEWTAHTDVSGRTIYKTPLTISPTDNVTLEFKFKSIAYSNLSAVIGVDLSSGGDYSTRMALLAMYSNATSYYSSSSNNRNRNGDSTSLSASSVYKIVLNNGTAKWYKDDVEFASYSIERSAYSGLRYDVFNSNQSHLEYLKVIL